MYMKKNVSLPPSTSLVWDVFAAHTMLICQKLQENLAFRYSWLSLYHFVQKNVRNKVFIQFFNA